MGIKERIEALEARPSARDMWEFFKKTYIFLVQSQYVTDGSAEGNVSMENYLKEFEKTHGTMDDFITAKTEQWNRQHNKKKEATNGL